MTFILLSQIVFVCLLGAMSPGPSMVVVVNNAIFKDKFNGILTALGHGFGIGLYALFAVLGISLIIETNLILFNTIKVISIFFLLYLGIKAFIKENRLDFSQNKIEYGGISFLQGLSISLLNPKIFVWFLAIYSQFMSVENNFFLNVSLVIIASVIDALWYIFLVNLVTYKKILKTIKTKAYTIQRLIGLLFIIISVILLLSL